MSLDETKLYTADEIFDLNLTNQSAISCRACHIVHTTYDDNDWEDLGSTSPTWEDATSADDVGWTETS